MGPIVAIAGLCVLGVVVLVVARSAATPSVAMFQQIRETVTALQRIAASNVLPATGGEHVTGFSGERMMRQTARLDETIRFVYTVEEHERGFLHAVSSQLLRRKPQKYQLQCMLVVMLTLNQQLGDAGIEQEDVQFDISRSELGTHCVAMLLSPDQHDAILEANPSRAERASD